MRQSRMMMVMLAAGLACGHMQAADGVNEPNEPLYVEQPGVLEFTGQMIVRPKQSAAWAGLGDAAIQARRAQAAAAFALNTVVYYPEVDEYVVSIPAGMNENTYAEQLMATGLYEYAQPNWRCFPNGVPNDPLFNDQWHHVNMRSTQAWDTTMGSQSIIIAVTDTGIDTTHPDLIANRVPGYHAPSDTPEIEGGPIEDINGHGTHVAGCAAAVGNNGIGVAGSAPNVKVMMCRVTDAPNGGASMNEILEAGRWAVDHGAKSASASYSGVSSPAVQTTGEYVKSKGGVYLYAAGNEGAYWSGFDWLDVIVVGASHPGDDRTGWSGYGPGVDLFSPGDGILATVVGGGYQAWSGTSMATPVCNGVVGLLFSINPDFTPKQIETFLFHGCKDLGLPGDDKTYGWGRVDSLGAVEMAKLGLKPQAPVSADDEASTIQSVPVIIDVLANDYDLNGDTIVIDQFQAQTQQGGTVVRIPGSGPGGRDELMYTPVFGFIGTDAFVYTIDDGHGSQDVGTVFITVEDPAIYRNPDNPANAKPGTAVSYYELDNPQQLPDFTALTPYKSAVTAGINFASTDGNFASSERSEEVGAVFNGYVSIPMLGKYTFSITSDDGSRLYVGDQLLIDNDGLHGMEEEVGTIALKPGKHKVRVEFFENGGGAGLITMYEGPGVKKKVIPAFAWSYVEDTGCYPDCDQDGVLGVDDFICFQTLFALQDPASDCDEDGVLGIDDFICFQTVFAIGC